MALETINQSELDSEITKEQPVEETVKKPSKSKAQTILDEAEVNEKNISVKGKVLEHALNTAIGETLVGELPGGKTLEQYIKGSVTNAYLHAFTANTFGTPKNIPLGDSVEFGLVNGQTISTLDYDKFVPSERHDNIETSSFWDKITLSPTIWQGENSFAVVKYYPYFLSGKVDELAGLIKAQTDEGVKLQADYSALTLLKTVATNLGTLDTSVIPTDSSTWNPTTPNVVSNATFYMDGIRDLLKTVVQMSNHNSVFTYGTWNGATQTPFAGYNAIDQENIRFIVHPNTWANIKKYGVTFLEKEGFSEYADLSKWVASPIKMFNVTGSGDKLLDVSIVKENQILVIDKNDNYLPYLSNLDSLQSEFFPKNLTMVNWANYRYQFGITKFAPVALFTCDALTQDFAIPTIDVTPTPPSLNTK